MAKYGRRNRGRNTDPTGVPYGSIGSVYNKPGSTNVVPTPVTTGTAYSKNQNLATGNVTEEGIVNDPYKNHNVLNQEQDKQQDHIFVQPKGETVRIDSNANQQTTNAFSYANFMTMYQQMQQQYPGGGFQAWNLTKKHFLNQGISESLFPQLDESAEAYAARTNPAPPQQNYGGFLVQLKSAWQQELQKSLAAGPGEVARRRWSDIWDLYAQQMQALHPGIPLPPKPTSEAAFYELLGMEMPGGSVNVKPGNQQVLTEDNRKNNPINNVGGQYMWVDPNGGMFSLQQARQQAAQGRTQKPLWMSDGTWRWFINPGGLSDGRLSYIISREFANYTPSTGGNVGGGNTGGGFPA